ncbi:FD-like protein [Drosera capensis]
MFPNEGITTSGATRRSRSRIHHISSASTSSSSSSQSPMATRTMENVWKDITKNNSFRSVLLQDFLNPKTWDPQQKTIVPPPPAPRPVQTHPTMTQMGLSLNSAPEFPFLGEVGDHDELVAPNFDVEFDVLSPFLASFPQKRFGDERCEGGGDRRHKRMVKNRESAARSRARKQVYVNELEEEVTYLREENTRLKKQQEQQLQHMMREARGQIQLQLPNQQQQQPQIQKLLRTSTAPF